MKLNHAHACCICHNPTKETQAIIHSLKLKLKIMLKDTVQVFDGDLKKGNKDSFARIIQIMHGNSTPLSISSDQCEHKALFITIKKKLRCSSDTLLSLIEGLIYQISERNYHLDTLNKQILNAASRLLKGNTNKRQKDEDIKRQTDEREEIESRKSVAQKDEVPLKMEEISVGNENKELQKTSQNLVFVPIYFPNNTQTFQQHSMQPQFRM